jgi:hypothetical protein
MAMTRALRLLRAGRVRFADLAQAEATTAARVRDAEQEASRLRDAIEYSRACAEGRPAALTEEAKTA